VTDERLTLRQAATRLGVSESAIRKRVERGTLRSDKGPDGRRYVYLDTGADTVTDEGADTSATGEPDALISEMRAHNATLQAQLSEERQAHAEARRLLMAALERIPPQLEAPRESPETAAAKPEGSEPRPGTEGTQEGVQRPQGGALRSLRRRLLGW
jgi:DNA-directed RNA polymerase specialized sigma24 family protein